MIGRPTCQPFVRAALLFCALFAVAEVGATLEIAHTFNDEANLVDTSHSNYALSLVNRSADGWRTASINGDQVIFANEACEIETKSLAELSHEERHLLRDVSVRILGASNGLYAGQEAIRSTTHTFRGHLLSMARPEFGPRLPIERLLVYQTSGGLFVHWMDEGNFSVSKSRGTGTFANSLERFFVHNNNLYTFVYADLVVLMKPAACLQEAERQLIAEARNETSASNIVSSQVLASVEHKLERELELIEAKVDRAWDRIMPNLRSWTIRIEEKIRSLSSRRQQQQQQDDDDENQQGQALSQGEYTTL